MKKVYIIILILGILILIGFIVSNQVGNGIKSFYFPVKNRSYHNIDPAFSFEYPEFEGMSPSAKDGEIIYATEDPNVDDYNPVRISWSEISLKVSEDYWDSKPKDKNGLAYVVSEDKNSIVFRLPKQGTAIEFDLSLTYEYKKQIYESILNSFK
jgi:hypothetical protein